MLSTTLHKIKNHSVARNAGALGIMQIANYIVPLLLLPFLTRQLGAESFGAVVITLAAIHLASVLTDYGFTISATYSVSLNRDNTNYINEKISSILGAKIILIFIAVLLLLAIPYFIPNLSVYKQFFAVAVIATIARALQPIWLFQGLEKMKNITTYTILTKLMYAALVLLFIQDASDAILVIFFWGIAQLLGLFAALYFAYKLGYRVFIPQLINIKKELMEGLQFFWSRLAVAIYTSASVFVVGMHSPIQAAQYAVCEQIYKAGQNVTAPINGAMFPYMAKNKDWKMFYKVLAIIGTIMLLGCIILSFFARDILELVFGNEYGAATPVLLIFLATTIINYFAISFGYSAFSALGKIKIANMSVIAGAVFHLFVLNGLYFFYDTTAFNVALAVLCTEILVTLIRSVSFVLIKRSLPI